MFELKSIEELFLITLESDAKFEEKLTCGLKNDMRSLTKFQQRNRKSQTGTLKGSFHPKYKMYDLKILREVICHDNEE